MTGCVQRNSDFGLCQIIFADPNTLIPYGDAVIVEGFNFNDTAEDVELRGGKSPYPWKIGNGAKNSEISMTLRERPDFLYQIVYNAAPLIVDSAANTAGTVTDFQNVKGTTGFDPVNGVASINVTTGANLRGGMYIAKWETATTLKLYKWSEINLDIGTTDVLAFEDGQHLMGTYTITNGGTTLATKTNVNGGSTDLGFEFVGGSAVNGTVGDTFTFEVVAPNYSLTTYNITDKSKPINCAIGVVTESDEDGSFSEYMFFNVKISGLPLALATKDFESLEITGKLINSCCFAGAYAHKRHLAPAPC